MYKINIVYIILSLTIDNNNYCYHILVDSDSQLPKVSIDDSSIFVSRSRCIKNYTDLELVWLDDKLLDLELLDDTLNIYYTCNLPIETKINNGKFIPITSEMAVSPQIQKAIARS